MLYAVLVAALVALDQLVKYLVVQQIPLGEHAMKDRRQSRQCRLIPPGGRRQEWRWMP